MSNDLLIATFIGHRDASLSLNGRKKLKAIIEKVIASGVKTFWCGAHGSFDGACASILKELKEYYLDLKVYVVSPYLSEHYLRELNRLVDNGYYDGIILPPIEAIPQKYAILARNKYMIDHCCALISYVNATFGGAYTAYKYAKRKHEITVFNLGILA